MKDKLVLITGAGFSVKAGIPIQSVVLRRIIEFEPLIGNFGRKEYNLAKQTVIAYLNAVFFQRGQSFDLRPEDITRLGDLTLEDVYTIIDKAVSRHDWLPNHDWKVLVEVRRALDLCVLHYLTHVQDQYEGVDYRVLAERLTDAYGMDWATITLNWDTVWDKAVLRASSALGKVTDYGCSPPWLEGEDYHVNRHPPDALGVKLLKLHGSFNWVTCPRCRTLFVSEVDLGRIGYLDSMFCPLCVPGGVGPTGPSLTPLFLTPTIMKAFENPSLNLVWDNAIYTLADATHVVFVGYSFPLADHDLRYMLRKAVPPRAKISVVLHENDDPNQLPAECRERLRSLLAPARYKAFFGLGDDAFHFGGWETFFERLLG